MLISWLVMLNIFPTIHKDILRCCFVIQYFLLLTMQTPVEYL